MQVGIAYINWIDTDMTRNADEHAVLRELRAHMSPVKQTALHAAQEVRDELKEPVADAVESVRGTAQEAVTTTTEHAQSAGQEIADELRQVGRDTAAEVRNDPGTQRPAPQSGRDGI